MGTGIYDVVIVGGGPTGLVLANLLGKLGITTAVVEKEAIVYPVPRATHIDEETLRNFQATGLMPQLERHTTPFGVVDMVDEKGKVLFAETIIQPASQHHYMGSRFFDQPAFEQILRVGLRRYPNVAMLLDTEVLTVSQTENEARVVVRNNANHKLMELNARWVVGCDGGKSIVRTLMGIAMNPLDTAREWVIVDTLLKKEADARLLPNNFRYIFNPERLTIFAYGIGINNRWEFQLGKDEPMPDEQTIQSWVAKYIGLDKIEITRIAKYAHHSLVAQGWRCNRIFLAGDAAHMMPPSAGQGLCSGIRDAINLAWKLNEVITGRATADLLDTYEQERRPHLYEMVKRTLFFSNRLQGDNSLQRIWRKIHLRAIELVTPIKNYLRASYNTSPIIREGCLSTSILAGHHLPQVNILLRALLSDDFIGYRFAVVALPNTLTAAQTQLLKDESMVIVHEQTDLFQTSFPQWLEHHKIDFAIIRPDKIIFGTGKAHEFENVLNQLANWKTRKKDWRLKVA